MKFRKVLALAAVSTWIVGCSSTPEFQTGPDAEISHDRLTRADNTVMDAVWARTDIDLSGYSKVIFDGVGVEYRPTKGPYSGRGGTTTGQTLGRNEFQLDDATKELFETEIRTAFIEELAKSNAFEMVDEDGADVLRLNVALLDVVSRVPPETVGRSRIFIDRVGEATVVMELRDSVSNAIFARAIDRRAAENASGRMMDSSRVTNTMEVRRLGRQWGTIVRNGLNSLLGSNEL
jgi:hypothetical protein